MKRNAHPGGEIMVRLLSLFILVLSLSACGADSNIDGDHTRVKVTYKDVSNVVYGIFSVPPGQSIVTVQLSYNGLFTGNLLTAAPCQSNSLASIGSGFGVLNAPSALFCPDNSFYFSGVTADSSVARATLSNGSYLYLDFSSYLNSADVSILSKDDWHNENGTSIEVD